MTAIKEQSSLTSVSIQEQTQSSLTSVSIQEQLNRIEEKLDKLLSPSKPPKKSKIWIKLVQRTLDDNDLQLDDIPEDAEAEDAIRALQCYVKFTDDLCESIVDSYPALQNDGDPYPWTQETHSAHKHYELLTDRLNAVFNAHSAR